MNFPYMRSVLFLTFFLFMCSPLNAEAQLATQPNIQVSADGIISVEPDYAVIRMNVTGRHREAGKAVNYSGDAMGQIISVLKQGFSVAEKDIQTSMIRVHPVYVSCHNEKRLQQIGIDPQFCQGSVVDYYNTSRGLTLKYRDIEKFPELLSRMLNITLKNDVQLSVYSMQFKTEKEDDLKRQARLLAAENAKKKAEEVAKALDAEVGGPIQINVDRVNVPVVNIPLAEAMPAMAKSRMMTADFAYGGGNQASVAVGEIEIRASINAVFALEDD